MGKHYETVCVLCSCLFLSVLDHRISNPIPVQHYRWCMPWCRHYVSIRESRLNIIVIIGLKRGWVVPFHTKCYKCDIMNSSSAFKKTESWIMVATVYYVTMFFWCPVSWTVRLVWIVFVLFLCHVVYMI